MTEIERSSSPTASSRYELLAKIASGGMATVHIGRVRGAAGFWRLVAIKRAHPHLVEQPEFHDMLVSEALLASRIHHTNVVSVLDVEERNGELLLVMDYVDGSSLSHLTARARERKQPIPAAVAIRIILDACAGLQAAHELTDEDGKPLGVVHRDVSPHNILVGTDGVGRIADFGIAKVLFQGVGATTSGVLKGKLSYMAPEYVGEHVLDARSDVFGMGVVLWEELVGRPLFRGRSDVETLSRITNFTPPPVSEVRPDLGSAFDAVTARALERNRERRYASAGAFAADLERSARSVGLVCSHAEVAAFLKDCLGSELAERRNLIRASTRGSRADVVEEATASMPRAGPAEPPAEPDAARSEIVTLPTAEVVEVEPTHTAPVPLLRAVPVPDTLPIGSPPDATQPSFAHSQVRVPPGSAPSRRRWVVAVVVGLSLAGVALALGIGSNEHPASRSGTEPMALAVSSPAESVLASPPQVPSAEPSTSNEGPTAFPPPPASAPATPLPRPSAKPTERVKRAPQPEHSAKPAASAPPVAVPAPPPPETWSPPDNPYSK